MTTSFGGLSRHVQVELVHFSASLVLQCKDRLKRITTLPSFPVHSSVVHTAARPVGSLNTPGLALSTPQTSGV